MQARGFDITKWKEGFGKFGFAYAIGAGGLHFVILALLNWLSPNSVDIYNQSIGQVLEFLTKYSVMILSVYQMIKKAFNK